MAIRREAKRPPNAKSQRLPATGLALRRITVGFTREELAAKLGVTADTIGRWERTLHVPRPACRRALGETLNLSSADLASMLIGGVDELADVVQIRPDSNASRSGTPNNRSEAPLEDLTTLKRLLVLGLENGNAAIPSWVSAAAAFALLSGLAWPADSQS